MKPSPWITMFLAVATTIVVACGDDTVAPIKWIEPPTPSTKLGVLQSVEWAYNQRRIDKYDEALDGNFAFYLAPGDFGGSTPASWDRAEELTINTHLFDKSYSVLPCQSIFLNIKTEDGLAWTEFNPDSAPTETWYSTTLYYDFKFVINPNTYIPNTGSRAVFTVRNAGTDTSPHWTLVEIRDLGGSSTLNASAAAATEPSTWGGVKKLYR